MRRLHRKIARKMRKHHRKQMGFLEVIRLYLGMPA